MTLRIESETSLKRLASTRRKTQCTLADTFVTDETKHHHAPVIHQFNVKTMFDNVHVPSSVNRLNVAVGEPRRFSPSATVQF